MFEYIVDQNQPDETSSDNNQSSECKKEESSEDYFEAYKLALTDENYI